MAVLGTDVFNRADADPMSGAWATMTSLAALRIVSNAVGTSGGSNADSGSRYTASALPNDQYSQWQLTTSGTNDGGPGCRAASGALSGYFSGAHDGNSHIHKFVTGSFTQLTNEIGVSWTTNDVLLLQASSTTITLKKNGTQISTTTDASLASGAAWAFIFNGSIRFDNFECGDLTTETVTVDKWHQRASERIRRQPAMVPSGVVGIKAYFLVPIIGDGRSLHTAFRPNLPVECGYRAVIASDRRGIPTYHSALVLATNTDEARYLANHYARVQVAA